MQIFAIYPVLPGPVWIALSGKSIRFQCRKYLDRCVFAAQNHAGKDPVYHQGRGNNSLPVSMEEKMKKIVSVWLICLFIMTTGAYGAAKQPIDTVKETIGQGIAILKAPEYAGNDKKEEQREKIWNLVQAVFDFNALSMRAVARDWKSFTDKQKDEFTAAFTVLLKNTYMDKLQGGYNNEEVVFDGQEIVADGKAMVKSRILREKLEIPMDYSLYLKGDQWRVYDVNIEGVSLVKNYRTQFREILAKETPDQLIQKLKEKNDTHKRDRLAKSQ